MGKFKGTKGKWSITDKSDSRISINKGSIEVWFGANFKDYPNEEEAKANALLISKSPEMLEMLEILVDTFDIWGMDEDNEKIILEAKRLIKEATTI